MTELLDYQTILSKAIQEIICYREPHSPCVYEDSLLWHDVEKETLVPFETSNYIKQQDTINYAKNVTLRYVQYIIAQLFEKYQNGTVIPVEEPDSDDDMSPILFSFKDKSNSCLLFFKEHEKGPMAISSGWRPSYIESACGQFNVQSFKLIYLLFDKAYLQFMGHNKDESDPGRGYPFYSLKWLFSTYFSDDEFSAFREIMNNYQKAVNSLIGYVSVRPLYHTSMITFKRILESQIIRYQYEKILSIQIADKNHPDRIFEFSQEDLDLVRHNYINNSGYLCLLGNSSFAESFITAEWLYSSMKQAKAVDFTVIGMGYCKAIEQLLYELICTYAGQNLQIKSSNSSVKVFLSQNAIDSDEIDSSIGSMAVFVRDYKEILLQHALTSRGKNFIKEFVFRFGEMRNEYFHKENIHDWSKIVLLRDTTFQMAFLLLGGFIITPVSKEKLKYPNYDYYTDYYRLCEYVNYHCEEHYIFEFKDGKEDWALGRRDYFQTVENDHIKYSGVYFSPFIKNKTIARLRQEDLPEKIYLAFLRIHHNYETQEIKLDPPVKTRLIFSQGKYVGPSLYEGIEY